MTFRLPVLFFCGVLSMLANAAPNLEVKLVTQLGIDEPYEAIAFSSGFFWSGDNQFNTAKVFRADGTLLATVTLPHSLVTISPYGNNQVIAVGNVSNPWQSYFSILTYASGQIQVETHAVPQDNLIGAFAGDPGNLYFSEVGDNDVLHWTGSRMEALKATVVMPGPLVKIGNTLFVIEQNSVYGGSENLVKMDLNAQTATRTFATNRQSLSHLVYIAERNEIAITDSVANEVLFIDVASNTLKETVSVSGGPSGLALMGHCLTVSSDTPKQVTLLGLKPATPSQIAQWDLTPAGDQLKLPRGIAADPNTGTIFVRSNYPCPNCTVTQSSVFSVRDLSGTTQAQCQ